MNVLTKPVAQAFAQYIDYDHGLDEGITGGGFNSLMYGRKNWAIKYQRQLYQILLEDGKTSAPTVDVIIVGVAPFISKIYFPPWTGAVGQPRLPICKSLKGDVPDQDASIKQATSCGICPHNEWSNKRKECQDHKRLAVLLMPKLTARVLGAPLTEPVFLKIPPGSFKVLKQYSDTLKHAGHPYFGVVTQLGFAPEQQFQLTFTAIQTLENNEAPLVLPLLKDSLTQRITGNEPAIREVRPQIEVKPSRIETGLREAFSAPQAAPQPRPAVPLPPQPAAPPQPQPQPVAKSNGDGAVIPGNQPVKVVEFEDAGSELNQQVADMLAKKVDGMLK